MSKAIRIHQTGGPEVLSWEDIEVGDPGPGQVRLQQLKCSSAASISPDSRYSLASSPQT